MPRRQSPCRTTAVTDDAVVFFVFAALALGGALGVVLARNPVHSALFLVVTLVSVAVFFVQQRRAPARGGADHRLRRRDRRAVPVRDHAARRRPRGVARRIRSSTSARLRSRSASIVLAEVLFLAGHHWATGARRPATPRSRAVAPISAATWSASRGRCSPTSSGRSRSRPALLVIAVVGSVVLARRSGQAAELRRGRRRRRRRGRRRRDHHLHLLPGAGRDDLHHRRGRRARSAATCS